MASNLSWQQIAVFALCLAAAFGAHKLLGVDAGMAAGVITSIIAFLMGRKPADAPSAVTASAVTSAEGITSLTVGGDVKVESKDGDQ